MSMPILSNSVLPMKPRGSSFSSAAYSKRVSHGGTRFAPQANLRQPQDGARAANEMPRRVASINEKGQPSLFQEPEDARLTGVTRSLFRRLMGLNVVAATQPEPATPAVGPVAAPAVRKQNSAVVPAISQARVA